MKTTTRMLALLAALIMIAALVPASAFADAIGTGVTKYATPLQSGPGEGYSRLAVIPKGRTLTLESQIGAWYVTTYDGNTGYVYYRDLDVTKGSAPVTSEQPTVTTAPAATAAPGTTPIPAVSAQPTTTTDPVTTTPSKGIGAGVTTAKCNFRSGPSTSDSKVKGMNSVKKGTSFTILAVSKDGKWYNVSIGNYTGWLYTKYCKVTSANNSDGSTTNAQKYAGFSGKLGSESDRWGSIQVAGTNISQYIYSNCIDSKGRFRYNAYSAKVNYIYALSYLSDNVAVIYGHNMRKAAKNHNSNPQGLHQLHHVQNAWLGIAKCEYCGDSCANSKTSTFDISYNGSAKWQLVAFYEVNKNNITSSSSRRSIEVSNSFQSALSGSALDSWLSTELGYAQKSGMKGAVLGTISSSDKVMMLVTCADSSGDSNQRLYMLLKAIG